MRVSERHRDFSKSLCVCVRERKCFRDGTTLFRTLIGFQSAFKVFKKEDLVEVEGEKEKEEDGDGESRARSKRVGQLGEKKEKAGKAPNKQSIALVFTSLTLSLFNSLKLNF